MKLRRRNCLPAVVLVVLTAILVSGCGNKSAGAHTRSGGWPVSLTLWLDWTPWGVHVPIFAAQQQGFFRKEGLNVSIRSPADVSDPLKLVASVPNTLGIGYMSDVVSAQANGVPVESIAALVQHHLNCIMTLHSSGITSPRQLVGKSIGQGGTPADHVILDTVFRHAGISGSKVRLVNLYPYVPALIDHRVDAIEGAYQVWEKIQMQQMGYRVNVIQLQKWGVPDEYELVLLASRSMISAQPGVLKRFMRAVDEGERFAAAHPSRAVADFLKINGSYKLSRNLVSQSWHDLIPFMSSPSVPFGSQSRRRWASLSSWMFHNDLVSKHIPAKDLFTTSFSGGTT